MIKYYQKLVPKTYFYKNIGGIMMETFNIIAGACSIVSFLISIFVVTKVYKISNNINIDKTTNTKQTVFGRNNKTAGRDLK